MTQPTKPNDAVAVIARQEAKPGFTVYAVYTDKKIAAAGSLLDCWTWLLKQYAYRRNAINGLHPADLAAEGIFIAPVGDHNTKPLRGYDESSQAA